MRKIPVEILEKIEMHFHAIIADRAGDLIERDGEHAKLLCESWCRVIDGSGQRHAITSEGTVLVEEGFV